MSQDDDKQKKIDEFFALSKDILENDSAPKPLDKVKAHFKFALLSAAKDGLVDQSGEYDKLEDSDGHNFLGFVDKIGAAKNYDWVNDTIKSASNMAGKSTQRIGKELAEAMKEAGLDGQDPSMGKSQGLSNQQQTQQSQNQQVRNRQQMQQQQQQAAQTQQQMQNAPAPKVPMFIDKQADEKIQNLLASIGRTDPQTGQTITGQQVANMVATYINNMPTKPMDSNDPDYQQKMELYNNAKEQGLPTKEPLEDQMYSTVETPNAKAFEINLDALPEETKQDKDINLYLPRHDKSGKPITNENGDIIQDIVILNEGKIVGAHVLPPEDQTAIGPETWSKIPGMSPYPTQAQSQGQEQVQDQRQDLAQSQEQNLDESRSREQTQAQGPQTDQDVEVYAERGDRPVRPVDPEQLVQATQALSEYQDIKNFCEENAYGEFESRKPDNWTPNRVYNAGPESRAFENPGYVQGPKTSRDEYDRLGPRGGAPAGGDKESDSVRGREYEEVGPASDKTADYEPVGDASPINQETLNRVQPSERGQEMAVDPLYDLPGGGKVRADEVSKGSALSKQKSEGIGKENVSSNIPKEAQEELAAQKKGIQNFIARSSGAQEEEKLKRPATINPTKVPGKGAAKKADQKQTRRGSSQDRSPVI